MKLCAVIACAIAISACATQSTTPPERAQTATDQADSRFKSWKASLSTPTQIRADSELYAREARATKTGDALLTSRRHYEQTASAGKAYLDYIAALTRGGAWDRTEVTRLAKLLEDSLGRQRADVRGTSTASIASVIDILVSLAKGALTLYNEYQGNVKARVQDAIAPLYWEPSFDKIAPPPQPVSNVYYPSPQTA